jgi:hypothetical protein
MKLYVHSLQFSVLNSMTIFIKIAVEASIVDDLPESDISFKADEFFAYFFVGENHL